MQQAQTLEDALDVLDPEAALVTLELQQAFYVPRDNSPIEDLRLLLTRQQNILKILFSGHRGSGKSSELARLRQELEDQYVSVHFSVTETLDPFDLTHVDVILTIATELLKTVQELGLDLSEPVEQYITDFASDVTQEMEKSTSFGAEAEAGILSVFAKLSARLRAEDTTREVVRKKVQGRMQDLFLAIDTLARDIQRNHQKRVLVIIEDFDKLDLDTAQSLMYGKATSLTTPHISIIYTFPIALCRDNNFAQIQNNFGVTKMLPNIRINHKDSSADSQQRDLLRALLAKRVKLELFEEDAIEELITFSGGIPRELIRLTSQACLEALKAKTDKITLRHAQISIEDKRNTYRALLSREQLGLLQDIKQAKHVDNTLEHRKLLHNLSVIEYKNDSVWFDVNPVVDKLLEG